MKEIADPSSSFAEFPGPILLLAGPGTGKTFQLAHRVKFLMEERGAQKEEIGVITFTNEAARNMRERLQETDVRLPPESQPGIISTMHSLGNTIIGTAFDRLGLPEEYRVLTDRYVRRVILQDAAYLVTGDRDRWKETDLCRRCGDCGRCPAGQKETRCRVCEKYVEIIRSCSAIDYDDQIMLACKLLRDDPDLATDWRTKTRYLLVDEYQDINFAQFEFIQHLTAGQTDGLFAVGDDDQSIYSFRGGEPTFIQNFGKHFGGETRIGRLAKSWRCPEHILKGGRSVIATYYPESVPKPEPTFSDKIVENHKIELFDVPSESWEANIIAGEIQGYIKDNRIIVIVPNSNYFPPLREALRRKGIPYRYKMSPPEEGLVRFAVLADWTEKPEDSLSFRHILDLIVLNHNELVDSLKVEDEKIVTKRLVASNLIAELWKKCDSSTPLLNVLSQEANKVKQSDFFAALKTDCIDNILSLVQNHGNKRAHLPQFLERCGKLVAPGRCANGLIDEIREWQNEIFETAFGSSVKPIEIYNMPSSKGLEAQIVFVLGVTEGLMPNPKGDLEEQSRLFYVAMTRAKKKLYLFSSRTRSAAITFKRESFQLKPSQFVGSIPKEHIEIHQIYPRKKK